MKRGSSRYNLPLRHLLVSSGYTLVETVVALALFLGVLIPLMGAIGVLTLDRKSDELSAALRLGHSEIAEVLAAKDFTDSRRSLENGFIIDRKVGRNGPLVEVRVEIMSKHHPGKVVLHLVRRTVDHGPIGGLVRSAS